MRLSDTMLEELELIYWVGVPGTSAGLSGSSNGWRTRQALLDRGLIKEGPHPLLHLVITKTGVDVLAHRRLIHPRILTYGSRPQVRPSPQLPPRPRSIEERPAPEPGWFGREDMLRREPERHLHVHQIDPTA